MDKTVPTTISFHTSETGDFWLWSVTLTDGDWRQHIKGQADGPHQASEMAIKVRDQLLREYEVAKTHYRNEQGEEIVVRHNSERRGYVSINTVWVQENSEDAYTYIRKVDLAQWVRQTFAPDNTLRQIVDFINSF